MITDYETLIKRLFPLAEKISYDQIIAGDIIARGGVGIYGEVKEAIIISIVHHKDEEDNWQADKNSFTTEVATKSLEAEGQWYYRLRKAENSEGFNVSSVKYIHDIIEASNLTSEIAFEELQVGDIIAVGDLYEKDGDYMPEIYIAKLHHLDNENWWCIDEEESFRPTGERTYDISEWLYKISLK